jgi:hypothetical protein
MKVRITNNKNIKTMEQKDIDIYEILKGMPDGTPLYTPMCGNVEFTSVEADKEKSRAIWIESKNGSFSFDKHGKWMKGGEALLFPSNEMRDWSKFFKKGDVLEYVGCVDVKGKLIFEKYEDETKIRFLGRFVKENEVLSPNRSATFRTADWGKSDDPAGYIRFVEERLGGKLNRETLEIEKPAFEIGKLYVFDEEDEDGNVTIIGELIGKNESEDTLRFGNQYEIENGKFVTDQAFDLRISVHEELREATEGEVVKFEEACTLWEKSKEKKGKKQPVFKPLDKVLVRGGKGRKWLPAFFVCVREEYSDWRCTVFLIHTGSKADFSICIPFEGHENLAFTDCDIESLPI